MSDPIERDNIYPGNTYTVAFECLKPRWSVQTVPVDQMNSYNGPGGLIPWPPLRASVRVLNTSEEIFLNLGGPGVPDAPAQVEGNIVSYTLPREFTVFDEATRLKMFIQVEWEDETVKTFSHSFTVMEYR